MRFDLALLVFTLTCVCVRSKSSRWENNLRTCKSDARCPDSAEVIVRCAKDLYPVCKFQCPLSHPLVSQGKCSERCLYDYHVKDRLVDTWDASEPCVKNTRCVKAGDRVIKPATSWHNTICGKLEDCKITIIPYATPPYALIKTLNALSLLWFKTIPKTVFDKSCKVLVLKQDVRECSNHTTIVDKTSCLTAFTRRYVQEFLKLNMFLRMMSAANL